MATNAQTPSDGNPLERLDLHIRSKQLVELHTHLLGMGSADFWVLRIMETYLPRVCGNTDWGGETNGTFKKHLESLMTSQLEAKSLNPTIQRSVKSLLLGLSESKIENNSKSYFFSFDDQLLSKKLDVDGFRKLYTDDVVYNEETLSLLFDLQVEPRQSNAKLTARQQVEIELKRNALHRTLPSSRRDFIIFNSRQRQFQFVQGITNTELLKLMHNGGRANLIRAAVRNGFSMLSKNGDTPTDPDLYTYQDSFTPEFDPKRFRMKDCIYQQRLEVLSILLNQVINRYDKAGVRYVEFSMGVKDLLNIHVWKHLVKKVFSEKSTPLSPKSSKKRKRPSNCDKAVQADEHSVPKVESDTEPVSAQPVPMFAFATEPVSEQFVPSFESATESVPCSMINYNKFDQQKLEWANVLGMYHRKPTNFLYGFIAAFNRKNVKAHKKVPLRSAIEGIQFLCKNNGAKAKQLCATDEATAMAFPDIFEDDGLLSRIQNEVIDGNNAKLQEMWKNYVIGLDWVGDELGFPYCAFVHSDFIGKNGIVWKMRQYQKRFGVRVHCGESVPTPPYEDNKKSLLRTAFETHLSIALDAIQRIHEGIERNLRIGHGVAFVRPYIDCEAAKNAIAFIRDNGIVLELNMTSNLYLLLQRDRSEDDDPIVKQFLHAEIPVVLSTDDDGIWIIRKCKNHYHHISVAGEFCKAITVGGIATEKEVDLLVETAQKATFY